MQVIYDKKNKEYPTWVYNKDRPEYELKDNFEFSVELMYKDFTRGRSALNIIWEDKNGVKYYSGMSMLDGILKNLDDQIVFPENNYKGLVISGEFTFKKQGTVILLTRVK